MGYGADIAALNLALTSNPADFIDNMIDQAIALPTALAPTWVDWTYSDYINNGLDFNEENQDNINEIILKNVEDLLNDNLRGRLTLFWHNHFVTELETYICARYLFYYYTLLQT